MTRVISSKNWGRKKSAKHFTSAKHKKAARLEQAWLKKSKTVRVAIKGTQE